MSTTVFRGTVILPSGLLPQGVVLVEGERIVAVGPEREVKLPLGATVIDAKEGYVSPGFVDIHTHGGGGFDFMDGTQEAVRVSNRVHARHGTTSIFPTTTTGTPAQLVDMLDAVESVRHDWNVADGARIGGVHWYGPYFATEKVGAHPKGYERNPDPAEYGPALARGIIKTATCAAELPGAVEFCRVARAAGCLVTCGHSNASWPEMAAVYEVGMRHVDHFWNAMSSTDSIRKRLNTPQRGSMAEFVLYHPEMSTEVIADGFHHAPEMLQFAYRMKGSARLCLVSDCSRALDTPPGIYRIGHHETGEPFENNGTVGVLPGTEKLAGSIFPMEHMIRVMMRDTDAGLAEVIRMASLTPAELTGLAKDRGSLEQGKLADVVLLSPDLFVQRTFINGVEFKQSVL
ncbi:MAG: N-acetylglucosamine-6-phosphate deacetylase [Gemmataceae bacterium]|nr:N-acetylglucosamine-6-phosphate deacetylase [Gemmataceae bacterium]